MFDNFFRGTAESAGERGFQHFLAVWRESNGHGASIAKTESVPPPDSKSAQSATPPALTLVMSTSVEVASRSMQGVATIVFPPRKAA